MGDGNQRFATMPSWGYERSLISDKQFLGPTTAVIALLMKHADRDADAYRSQARGGLFAHTHTHTKPMQKLTPTWARRARSFARSASNPASARSAPDRPPGQRRNAGLRLLTHNGRRARARASRGGPSVQLDRRAATGNGLGKGGGPAEAELVDETNGRPHIGGRLGVMTGLLLSASWAASARACTSSLGWRRRSGDAFLRQKRYIHCRQA